MAKENVFGKGSNRTAKFDEAHYLTALKDGYTLLIKSLNESDLKRKIPKKLFQIYGFKST